MQLTSFSKVVKWNSEDHQGTQEGHTPRYADDSCFPGLHHASDRGAQRYARIHHQPPEVVARRFSSFAIAHFFRPGQRQGFHDVRDQLGALHQPHDWFSQHVVSFEHATVFSPQALAKRHVAEVEVKGQLTLQQKLRADNRPRTLLGPQRDRCTATTSDSY